ncbi:DUF2612 domain-containing protein [Phocoenobacter skyensis]|uniref:DUF2612 domain-containing protein n=1 Tax=Phocoenobacter skyensis TaxID=97481 RepID=A0ABT9JIG6_9PAST|nr:DUF2612 domain-containing protein [Pasteurella skyensis]MDP8078322.1 DUF2612 domain-containing protein [Pasteurella skyensis]MDP8084586.1 DUF2612 domain-containing protein [Pasteurella skyensis]
MDLAQNHAEIAWSNNLGQFDKARTMRAFFMAIHKPFEDIQKSTKALFDERWLDTAKGKQLDGIGQILRQPRLVDFPIAIHYFGFKGQPNIGGFGMFKFKKQDYGLFARNIELLDDDNYRRVLYWRIAVITGSGTIPDIHKAMDHIFNLRNFSARTTENANIDISITLKDSRNKLLLNKIERWIPVAAGVGVNLTINES